MLWRRRGSTTAHTTNITAMAGAAAKRGKNPDQATLPEKEAPLATSSSDEHISTVAASTRPWPRSPARVGDPLPSCKGNGSGQDIPIVTILFAFGSNPSAALTATPPLEAGGIIPPLVAAMFVVKMMSRRVRSAKTKDIQA